jgi:hypothetical protein
MTARRTDPGWVARLADNIDRTRPDTAAAELSRLWDLMATLQLPGPGWTLILDELHAELIERDPEYRLLQVKEKRGGLRVYAEFDPAVKGICEGLVLQAEARAARTCERCGESGQLRSDRRWWLTLCDNCDATEPEGRPKPNDW